MDLTSDEAREMFPRDRGSDVDEADLSPWMRIIDDGDVTVIIQDDTWCVDEANRRQLRQDLADAHDHESTSLWDLFLDVDVSREVLDRNT